MRKPPYSMPPFLKIYPIVFKPHTSHWSKWLYKWPHKFNSKAADFRGFPWPIPTWWWPPLELIWNPPKIFFVLSIPQLVGETRWEKEKSSSPNPRLPSGKLLQFANWKIIIFPMGKSTISIAIFKSKLKQNYQRKTIAINLRRTAHGRHHCVLSKMHRLQVR